MKPLSANWLENHKLPVQLLSLNTTAPQDIVTQNSLYKALDQCLTKNISTLFHRILLQTQWWKSDNYRTILQILDLYGNTNIELCSSKEWHKLTFCFHLFQKYIYNKELVSPHSLTEYKHNVNSRVELPPPFIPALQVQQSNPGIEAHLPLDVLTLCMKMLCISDQSKFSRTCKTLYPLFPRLLRTCKTSLFSFINKSLTVNTLQYALTRIVEVDPLPILFDYTLGIDINERTSSIDLVLLALILPKTTSWQIFSIESEALDNEKAFLLGVLNSLHKEISLISFDTRKLQNRRCLDCLEPKLSVTSLEVKGHRVRSWHIYKFITHLPDVQSLKINSCNNISDFTVDRLAERQLKALSLTDCEISDVTFANIAVKCTSLATLCMRKCPLLTEPAIVNIGHLRNLNKICIDHKTMSDAAFSHIINMCTKLNKISLNHCNQLTAKGLEALSLVKSIQTLSLTNTAITDDLFHCIYEKNVTNLRSLTLSMNKHLTERVFSKISASNTLTSLHFLFEKSITNASFVTAITKFSRIQKLFIAQDSDLNKTGLLFMQQVQNLQELHLLEYQGAPHDIIDIIQGCIALQKIHIFTKRQEISSILSDLQKYVPSTEITYNAPSTL